MKFKLKTHQGKITKRYKRFFADLTLNSGELITAHTPNTGSMITCYEPGWKALVTQNNDPKRKLKYTLEMTHNGQTWIGVNTSKTNKLVYEALQNKLIKEFVDLPIIKPEVKYGDSRLDFLLSNEDGSSHFVEVKNVTLSRTKGLAEFPDAKTTRGQKHLNDLIKIVKEGDQASMLYVVQREDVNSFSPAKDIDPVYSDLVLQAKRQGVQILAYQCSLNEDEIKITHSLPVVLDD